MTGLTNIGAGNMRAGLVAAVAARAAAQYLVMIHCGHRRPAAGRMTGLTNIGAGNMRAGLITAMA